MSVALVCVLVGSIGFMPQPQGEGNKVLEVFMVLAVVSAFVAFGVIAAHLLCVIGGVAGPPGQDPKLCQDLLRVVCSISEYQRMDPEDANHALSDLFTTLPEKDLLSVRWVVDLFSSGLLGVANSTMKGIKPKMSDSARRMSQEQPQDVTAANADNAGCGEQDTGGRGPDGPGTAWVEK
jgi:hypothetical protein